MNSRWLLFAFIALLASAIAWSYSVYFLERDFIITDNVACDPITESCFIQDCDSSDSACDSEPYKRIVKNAAFIKSCPNYILEECPALTCEVGELDCALTLCSKETVKEGEICIHTPESTPEAKEATAEKITE